MRKKDASQNNERCKVPKETYVLRKNLDIVFNFKIIDCKSYEECIPNGDVYFGDPLG